MCQLHQAAEAGDIETLRRLIRQGMDVNAPDYGDGGRTPLHVACSGGHQDVVKELLANGGNGALKMCVPPRVGPAV